jgi:hypothetical protein
VVECHPVLISVQVTCRDECVLVELIRHGGRRWMGVCDARWAGVVVHEGFTDGESRFGIDCSDGVGPQCTMVRGGESGLKRCCCLGVGGVAGLLVESAVKQSIGYGGLTRAAMLAAPEALELGGLEGVAWCWELEKEWA